MQAAFDSLDATKTLSIAQGKTYRHTAVLRIRRADAHVTGPGTILATNEAQEAIFIEADRVTLNGGLVLKVNQTTRRFSTHESNKLRIVGRVDTLVEGITIDGAGGAGIFIGDASSRFTVRDVRVKNTRADGIHMTRGSHHGSIIRPYVSGQGDDGVAVVSYADQPSISHDITIESPRVENQYHGRGVAVVGGDHIMIRNVNIVASSSAAVYIATEGSYNTYSTRNVHVIGGTVRNSNTDSTVGHGAVLVNSGHTGYDVRNVEIDGLRIIDTRTSAPSVVGVRGSPVSGIVLTDLAISGRRPNTIAAIPAGADVTTSGWTVDGQPYDPQP
jgi:hypothetical protein